MPINPQTPIQISTTLDKIWVSRVLIESPMPDGESNAQVRLIPYSSENPEIVGRAIMFSINDIKAKAMSGNLKLAAAMGAILSAVQEAYDLSLVVEQPIVEEPEVPSEEV